MGWEATTLRDLASELAFVALADRGFRIVDEIEQAAIVDAALDRTVELLEGRGSFRTLAGGPGFRRVLSNAIDELRLAGVPCEQLDELASGPRESRLDELAAVYREYVRELAARRLADPATVFESALDAFATERVYLAATVFVVPGLRRRGLHGKLLARLLREGATVLDGEPVHGLLPPADLLLPFEPQAAPRSATRRKVHGRAPLRASGQLELLPSLDSPQGEVPSKASQTTDALGVGRLAAPTLRNLTVLSWLYDPGSAPSQVEPLAISFFVAASPSVELREVLRRALARGYRWDEIEIIAADPLTYGAALDTLTATSAIDVTYGVGLPIERSRVGRALRTYLVWVERGFHARPLAEALARGEIRPPAVHGQLPSGTGVARRLRELRIGWGRGRYADALEGLPERIREMEEARAASVHEEADPIEVARQRERRALEFQSLEVLLRQLIAAMPAGVPDEGRRSVARTVTAAGLAEGALRFLGLFRPRRGSEEGEALERVRERLTRVAEISTRSTTLFAALAELRLRLELRIPRPGTRGPLPWTSAAGALHITDLTHGGRSGRPCTFIVGLDAERVAAGLQQDPLLPDVDRQRLASGSPSSEAYAPRLPTSADRIDERRYEVAALLASLRGEVTLSFAGWEAATGSILSPAPVLLQLLRARERNPTLTFEDLAKVLGAPVSLVPETDVAADPTDVWLRALADGPRLLNGVDLVRRAFPRLDAGLRAEGARTGASLTAYHGWLPHLNVLDSRVRRGRPFSPSEIQRAGRCPLAWFYHYGLGVRKLDEPEYEAGRWLTDLDRGGLLHRIFEQFGRNVVISGLDLKSPEAEALLARIVEEELVNIGHRVPAPSSIAREIESEEIRRSSRLFLEMERKEADGDWLHFELSFGKKEVRPAGVTLPSGRVLPLQGMVDRVDRLPEGKLRVIDYKTGKSQRFDDKLGRGAPFDGGREIQSGLYARAVETTLGEVVKDFQYRFPTERGETRSLRIEEDQFEGALDVAESLVNVLEGGLLLATDEPQDCRICDHQRVCRVSYPFRTILSPRADWSREHRDLPEYATMVRLRSKP